MFVFFNLRRFFQTVNGKATIGSKYVVNGIKEVAAAPLSGLVLSSTKPSRAIFASHLRIFFENPEHQGRGGARSSFSLGNKVATNH